MRCLIVEDDPVSRIALQCILEPLGPITVATTAAEIDAALADDQQDTPFELVCLDIHLPDACGLDLIDDIRARLAGTPRILIVTASNDRRHVEKALAGRVDGYLLKPVVPEAFQAKLDDLGLTASAS